MPRCPNRRQASAAIAAVLAAPLVPRAAVPATRASAELRRLVARYFAAAMDENPFWASSFGVATPAQAAAMQMDIAPAQRERMRALSRTTLAQLSRIDVDSLAGADHVTQAVLAFQCRDDLANLTHPWHLLPLDQMAQSPPFQLAEPVANGLSAFASADDYAAHLARLRQLPRWCEQAVTNLREGVRTGVVLPAVLIERMLPMLRELADGHAYLAPLDAWPAAVPAGQRAALRRDYERCARERVAPAITRLVQVVEREVLPHGRPSAGLAGLPGGKAWYAQCIRSQTTRSLDAGEVHALGHAEVARLRTELTDLQRRLGMEGDPGPFFAAFGARDEARPFRSVETILEAYRALDTRISSKLPSLFGRAPRAAFDIRVEPGLTSDTGRDHFVLGTPDGARPGVFYAVIGNPADYERSAMATLLLHEGRPGHAYQWTIAQELDLPALQRCYVFNAFSEGWAHYVETLGHDLSLYDDAEAHVGHLRDALLRAARLVVDTGLHDRGWSRDEAMRYLVDQTGYDEPTARAAIERYMAWPGQALGYTIGKKTIEGLRDETRRALGARFTLAAFHDAVIGSGSLPLQVLQDNVRRLLPPAG